MFTTTGKLISIFVGGVLSVYGAVLMAQQTKPPFTVRDEIGLTLFGDPNGGAPQVRFSPDGKFFAVWSERGRLDLNVVEDSLRFYGRQDVEDYLRRSDVLEPPAPVWVVNCSHEEGAIIGEWRWLSDSSGVAFLEGSGFWGDKRLLLADLRKRTIELLTSGEEAVKAFDISDRRHFVYTALEANGRDEREDERHLAETVGTGRPLYELMFPDDPVYRSFDDKRTKKLWVVVDGKRFEVKANGAPLVPEGGFALSPDGRSLVTEVKVSDVPASWEALYPPPYPSYSPNHVHAGSQDVRQYVLIELTAGSVRPLTGAPISIDAGWSVTGNPSWSRDGEAILLPGTFLPSKDHAPSRPCVAVVDLPSESLACVERLKGHTETGVEDGYRRVSDLRFIGGDKDRVKVVFADYPYGAIEGATEYRRLHHDTWGIVGQSNGNPAVSEAGLEIAVRQSFNEAPVLVAANKQASRTVWDPNPQLKNLDLGQATVYAWKTKEGRQLKGGLFKPPNYEPGRRYPLVIQTHGFIENEFRPSGVFPTGFAAEVLAEAGIAVLQIQEDSCPLRMASCHCPEGPCEVSEYEAAADRLVSEGLVDRERIGIIGFSRTCFYVMEALTMGSLHLKAALISDGILGGYPEYMVREHTDTYHSMIGAPPFGEGLQLWLKRSPGFNLDKVGAPLMVVGAGPWAVLCMWEPYAGLRYLHKPVDLIMLNSREHILTNPAVRMASQGGSVDWFRFWLQGYEDPDPAKAEQYKRWRKLREMQSANGTDTAVPDFGRN